MQTDRIHFRKALLPSGWKDDVLIEWTNGSICRIDTGVAEPGPGITRNPNFAIPGLVNVHSHAFQHAFAGLSEYRTSDLDSFWTWRKLMYQFLQTLSPDDLYQIAKRLYAQMKLAGYTVVAEFHYLLHQINGQPYENINETADVLIQAALDCGLRMCMLPVLYQRGGFDDSPLVGGQLRFGSSNELYLSMLDKLRSDWGQNPAVRIGVALHSLRAVSISNAQSVLCDARSLLPDYPIHIHVAEQVAEVESCVAATGLRPVQLLLDSFDVGKRWCLIHATHMTDPELEQVAKCDAVVGVCPTTEANLGDGIFRASDFLKANGCIAIGSDSNISVDPCHELRLLEYAQRLASRKRAVLCNEIRSCGDLLYSWCCKGGAQVTGFGPIDLQIGSAVGLTSISADQMQRIPDERIMDACIFRNLPGQHPFQPVG